MNSSEEAKSFTRAEKKLPLYLQPSSGSCHDFCKYGKHHESGKNPSRPSPRRQKKKPVNGEYPGKKTAEVELNPQCNVKADVFDNPEIMKCEVLANSVDRQPSDRIKFKKKSGAILTTEAESESLVARVILKKNMTLVTKSSDSPISVSSKSFSLPGSLHLTSGSKISEIKTERRTRSLGAIAKKGLASPRGSSFSPRSSGHRIRRVLSSKTSRNGIARGASSPKTASSSNVSLSRVVRGFSAPKASLPSKNSVSGAACLGQKEQGGSEVKPVVKNQKRSGKINTEHQNNDEVQEKHLYVIKMETENMYIDLDMNEEMSPIVPSPLPSNHSEPDDEESRDSSTNADDEPIDDDESNYAEDDDDDALEGENKHMIRRLKFRRGRVLGENHNAESNTKLHFQEGGSSDGKPDDRQVDPEKVVLRHQDVQGKKDTQVLLNNVIEETASKLVETRKSKVKSLVGAFETVISLQDHKPSANTVS